MVYEVKRGKGGNEVVQGPESKVRDERVQGHVHTC
jgi:hypothetical protein